MSFTRHGLEFEGAFRDVNGLKELPGVFVIWCKGAGQSSCLLVRDADNVRRDVAALTRSPQLSNACHGAVVFAAHYTGDMKRSGRELIAAKVAELEHPTMKVR